MIIKDNSELSAALNLVQKSDKLALDIETTGLNPRKDKIIGIGLSNGTESVYLAHLVWDGEKLVELLSTEDVQTLLNAVKQKQIALICHNGSFDLRFISYFFSCNLIDQLWSDSMLIKHTCDEEFPFGLKEIGAKLFGADAKAEQIAVKESIKNNGGGNNEFYKADLTLMAKYCMQDCMLTFKINEHYLSELEAQGLTKFYFEDEVMPLYRNVTIPMEMAGIPLDVSGLKQAQAEIEQDIKKLETELHTKLEPHLGLFKAWFLNKDYPVKLTGPFVQTLADLLEVELPLTPAGKRSLTAKNIQQLPESHLFRAFLDGRQRLGPDLVLKVQLAMHGTAPMLNLHSKHHLKKIFFDTLGCEPLSKTPTGLPQIDEEFLDSVADKFDFVPLLIDYNKLNKIKSAYIDRLLEEQEDGIFYPSFQQHRTVSGRYGSDFQQLPRMLEEGQASEVVRKYNNMIRNFIIAAPEHVLIGADYESLEPKVFAHVSGDDRLKDIFRQGKDFYSEIAIRTEKLTGVSSDKKAPNYLGKVNKAARQKAKAYSLGIPYGLTGFKLKHELNIEQDVAEQLVQDYLTAFPDLANWMQESDTKAKTEGRIRSEAGRIRHLPQAKALYDKHGDKLLDSLWLWKVYHDNGPLYTWMKEQRSRYKNYLNNSKNFQIQSLAASIVNQSCILLAKVIEKGGFSAKIVLQAHDEVVVHCPKSEASKVCEIMKAAMENCYKISVPLVADPNVALKYGDTK